MQQEVKKLGHEIDYLHDLLKTHCPEVIPAFNGCISALYCHQDRLKTFIDSISSEAE